MERSLFLGFMVLSAILSGTSGLACPNLTGSYYVVESGTTQLTLDFKQKGCEELVIRNKSNSEVLSYLTDGVVRKVDEQHPAGFGGSALSIWFTSTALASNNFFPQDNGSEQSIVIASQHTVVERDGLWDLKGTIRNLDPLGADISNPVVFHLKRAFHP